MQTDAEPFLQRIRAFPDDDVPRLIFADWLDEQAGWVTETAERDGLIARAEFIRVQIALARLPEDTTARTLDATRHRLLRAERELLDRHRDGWAAAFRGLASDWQFRRGFVEEVKIAARQYLRHAHELFAAGPIQHIRLLDVGGSLPAVLRCPYLGRITALTVYAQHAGEPLARALARAAHLAGLRVLDLRRNRLADEDVGLLAAAPAFANLEELDLGENEIGECGARCLAASPHLGRLTRLELRANRLGPGGAEALAGTERLTALQRLGLAENDLGASRLHTLSRAPELLNVPMLDLSANGLTAAGLKALLATPPGGTRPQDRADSAGVRDLDLSHNEFGDDGARALAAAPHLSAVATLRLVGCGITDEGVRALAAAPHLGRLTHLDLSRNPFGDVGSRAFLEATHFTRLCRLIVSPIGVSRPMQRALEAKFHPNKARS